MGRRPRVSSRQYHRSGTARRRITLVLNPWCRWWPGWPTRPARRTEDERRCDGRAEILAVSCCIWCGRGCGGRVAPRQCPGWCCCWLVHPAQSQSGWVDRRPAGGGRLYQRPRVRQRWGRYQRKTLSHSRGTVERDPVGHSGHPECAGHARRHPQRRVLRWRTLVYRGGLLVHRPCGPKGPGRGVEWHGMDHSAHAAAGRAGEQRRGLKDRKSTRLNSSHRNLSRMPSSA